MTPFIAFSQDKAQLRGTIKNYNQEEININIYKNWIETPVETFIKVDSNGRFEIEFDFSGYNYIDLNIGRLGYLFWMIKGGDRIYLLLDYDKPQGSFFANGKGAAKWSFQNEFKQQFELDNNDEYNFKKNFALEKSKFIEVLDSTFKLHQDFLESNKTDLEIEYFLLKKADIIGKRNRLLTEYAQFKNLSFEDINKELEFYSVSPERQALSFEFNEFYEELIALYKKNQRFEPSTVLDEINFLKALFYSGKIERPITEQKVHQLLLGYIENHFYQPEMQKGYDEYSDFIRNKALKEVMSNAIARKIRYQEGFTLPLLSLNGFSKKEVDNKAFSKKYTLLYVYEDDCIICEEDFQYFQIIANNFDKKDKFQYFLVNINAKKEYEDLDQNESILVQPLNDKRFVSGFSIEEIPQVFLVDNEGKVFGDLNVPSMDGGRSIIEFIKNKMPVKEN